MIKFITAVLLSFLPGFIGRIWTPGNTVDSWYNTIEKSFLNPPGYVFGIVWPGLYLLLGVAFYLVIKNSKNIINHATKLFGIHLFLNGLWSFLFFGVHLIVYGAVNITALIIIAIIMRSEFGKINKSAGILIWPYIAWLIFALYLNISIIFLN